MTDIVTKVSIWGQVVPIGWGSEWQEVVYLTQAEYDALPASKLTDGKIYKVKTTGVVPGGSTDASDVEYDNTTSGLTADNVQDAIDEVNSNTSNDINNLTNKVNYLEINGWFFPLIADNIIYSGSSFSYTATEDTLLYISDAADSYLKIDWGDIAGQYTPWYIHVIEWQTITYSRNCKVYKANNTLVIDDTDVTLWLMDDQYLWPVNYQDNQVSSINSAHLDNNKVATATGTWDLEFHFNHEFNTQHSKMDETKLVMSWVNYSDYSKTNIFTWIDEYWNFENQKETTIENIPFKIWNDYYCVKDITGTEVNLYELDENYSIIWTRQILWTYSHVNKLSVHWRFFYRTGWGRVDSSIFYIDDDFSVKHSEDVSNDIMNIYYVGNDLIGTMSEWNKYASCAVFGKWFHLWWIETNVHDQKIVCYTNGDVYVYNKRYDTPKAQKYSNWVISRIDDLTQLPFYNIIDQLGKTVTLLDDNNNIISRKYSRTNDNITDGKNNSEINVEWTIQPIVFEFSQDWVKYLAYNVIDNNNNVFFDIKVNNNTSLSKKRYLCWEWTLSSISFWQANFTTTDTVSIDVTIKNNSWESRTVTLPKSWWSTRDNTTTGTWTTFTFNS